MNAIINVISNKIGGVCLPRDYLRDAKGKIGCDVIWTMPPGGSCDEYEYLNEPQDGRPQTDISGKKRCVVDQLPVIIRNTSDPSQALDFNYKSGLGWYYDDFSADMQRTCKTTEHVKSKQRISFTLNPGMNGQNEDPPSGVSIELECLEQIAIWPDAYSERDNTSRSSSDAESPSEEYILETQKVGLPCEIESGVLICPPSPPSPGDLFCSEQSNRCALSCLDDDCPVEWFCDDSQIQEPGIESAYCVNPICEIPEGEALNCGNSDVGEKCIPLYSPAEGFSSNDVYIETNAQACETRICGVFKFEGDPREQVMMEPINDKVYCTCRCSSPDPDVSTCTCPDAFECSEDILINGGSALAGGYCVRHNAFFASGEK